VVHCDFKPDNVLIGQDGRARVVGSCATAALPFTGKWRATARWPPRGLCDPPEGVTPPRMR